MTAYRYVRLGQLPSTQRNGRVEHPAVRPRGVRAASARRRPARPTTAAGAAPAWCATAWWAACGGRRGQRVDGGRAGARRRLLPHEVYLDLLAPALRGIGQGWQEGTLSVGDEHRASAVAIRLVGRLGPHFVRRGRHLGTVVRRRRARRSALVPVSLLADIVRAHGFRVVDLGANVPAPRSPRPRRRPTGSWPSG